jgi:hypothetical protein
MLRKGEMMEETSKKESTIVENVRAYITKTGNMRTDKLKPIVYHDNRKGGSYNYGKNLAKREKKALKNK